MNLTTVLLVLCTVLLVLGVIIAVLPIDDAAPAPTRSTPIVTAQRAVRLGWAGGVVILVVAISGWLVPALVMGCATWYWVGAFQRRDRSGANDVARTDALASWIENLRDVLLAGDQPIGAISATVPTAPPVIRPAVRRLSTALGHLDADTAFRRFADDLDDPLGDLVAAGLLIAVQRGARTVAVLTALAEQARSQADRRRIVDAERAPIQREVSLLSLIMGALIVGLVVFGRGEYLEPYDTSVGQLFLTVILAIYSVLLLRVQRLARFPKPSRFLTAAGARKPAPPAAGPRRHAGVTR